MPRHRIPKARPCLVRASLAVALGLAIAACLPPEETPSDGGDKPRGYCEYNLDCPVGQACVDNRCRQVPCDGRCTSDEVCVLTECVAAEGLDCVEDRGICPGGFVCSSAGICQRLCVTDEECPSDERPTCNPEAGGNGIAVCAACTFSSDCPAERPHCTDTGQCVECGNDLHCEENGKPVGKVCDPATALCVPGCKSGSDCRPDERCEGATAEALGLCVECSVDTETIDCSPRAPRVRCQPATRLCVECLGDGDCSGRGQCDLLTNTCVECTTNEGCEPGNVCDQSTFTCMPGCVGGKGGPNCPEHTVDASLDQVCDASQGDHGVCVDCLVDAHCPRAHVCEGKACVPGCRTTEAQCAVPSGLVAFDVYCDPGRGAFGECVECLNDGHCGADQVCDADEKRCRCKREGEACAERGQCGFRRFTVDGKVDCTMLQALCVGKVICNGVEKPVQPVCGIFSEGLPGQLENPFGSHLPRPCPDGFITEQAKDVGGSTARQCVPNTSAYRCN